MIPGRMFGPYITRDIYTTYNSFYCYESTFEIEAVKPEDIGTVYVYVSNEKGHAGAQIHIQLAKDQAIPGKLRREINFFLSDNSRTSQTTNRDSRLALPPVGELLDFRPEAHAQLVAHRPASRPHRALRPHQSRSAQIDASPDCM